MAQGRGQDVELAETLAVVARALLGEQGVDATLRRICVLAVETVPGCQAVGISLVEGRRITSLSRTGDLPRVVDAIQSETLEGPCIDAIKDHAVFLTGRLSEEERWPNFARRAYEETGVQSILALRLFDRAATMGALNLYSRQVDAFDDQDIAVGSVFAAHAAVALTSAERQGQLEDKAATRDVIGMAKGIIMARQGIDEDAAFQVLRRASQRTNVKLRELAERVVHPGAADVPATGNGDEPPV